jgi:hypothetical protein
MTIKTLKRLLLLHEAAAALGLLGCIFAGCMLSFLLQKAEMDIAVAKQEAAVNAKVEVYLDIPLSQFRYIKI